ncbi:MAG: carbohydrate kinase family protein [Candidatus Acidiferrales bacterium]
MDVVGVGLNATDTVIRLPHFPAFNSKVEIAGADVFPGGQVASAMVACALWGLHARYIGSVGDDSAAELQRREFAGAGVEAHLRTVPQCSSQQAFILVDQGSGERTILWRRDARLALQPEHLSRELIVSARALHVDGHDNRAAAQAARWAREMGIPVTADVDNLYPHIEPLLDTVDYLIASEEFPARLTGERDLLRSLPAIAQRHGCRVAGVTLGRDGVLVWARPVAATFRSPPVLHNQTYSGGPKVAATARAVDAGFLYCPAYQVEARDTTGAGDIFHGAFLYALLAGWPLPRALDFSCAAAGLNCTALGARGGIRPVAEIEWLMRTGARRQPRAEFAPYGSQSTADS